MTAQPKHTPGPWQYRRVTIGHPDNAKNPIVSAPGYYIARLFCQEATLLGMTSRGPETLEEAEANARLIAAAPALLAAAKEWLTLWLYIREHYPDIELPNTFDGRTDACGRLRAAISKAAEREA